MNQYRLSWVIYGSRITQLEIEPHIKSKTDARRRRLQLSGIAAKVATNLVSVWIKEDKVEFHRLRDIEPPLLVDEFTGVRISLLCMLTNCLQRIERIEGLNAALRNMTWEEIYYWYSKCQGESRHKGLKAFRILFDQC